MSEKNYGYGLCPECGAPGVARERVLNGNDRCENGHTYPSATSLSPSAYKRIEDLMRVHCHVCNQLVCVDKNGRLYGHIDGHRVCPGSELGLSRCDFSNAALPEATELEDNSILPLEIIREIEEELSRAINKFPTWPDDPIHAMSVVNEEAGETTKAVNESVYEPDKSSMKDVRAEGVQLAAMAIRFLKSQKRYKLVKSNQHDQGATLETARPEALGDE